MSVLQLGLSCLVILYRVILVMSNGTTRLEIPRGNPINAVTMYRIARKAGLTREQFEALY